LLIKRLNSETDMEVEDLQFVLERLRLMERQAANCIEIQRRYLGFLRRRSDDATPVGINQLLRDLERITRVHPSLQDNEPACSDVAVKIDGRRTSSRFCSTSPR
jgi:hypothetical protein